MANVLKLGGLNNKPQITAVFAGILSSNFLPVHLVYQGTTNKCRPTYPFPDAWHVTHTSNHWCNESTKQDYIDQVPVPYVILLVYNIRMCYSVSRCVYGTHYTSYTYSLCMSNVNCTFTFVIL